MCYNYLYQPRQRENSGRDLRRLLAEVHLEVLRLLAARGLRGGLGSDSASLV